MIDISITKADEYENKLETNPKKGQKRLVVQLNKSSPLTLELEFCVQQERQ